MDLTRSFEFSQEELKDLQSEVVVLKKTDSDSKVIINGMKSQIMEVEQRQNYQEDCN